MSQESAQPETACAFFIFRPASGGRRRSARRTGSLFADLAEWSGRGLPSRSRRFDSGNPLQCLHARIPPYSGFPSPLPVKTGRGLFLFDQEVILATKKVAVPTMADEQDWRAREDMHTLARAKEIESDSKRHAAAKRHAGAEAQKYARVANSGAKPAAKRGAR